MVVLPLSKLCPKSRIAAGLSGCCPVPWPPLGWPSAALFQAVLSIAAANGKPLRVIDALGGKSRRARLARRLGIALRLAGRLWLAGGLCRGRRFVGFGCCRLGRRLRNCGIGLGSGMAC